MATKEVMSWYKSQEWQRKRRYQLNKYPLCNYHLQKGETVAATVADHVTPHRGNKELFFNGELQSLCKSCHDSIKQGEETRGYRLDVGLDGWPIDNKHPANREEK